MADAGAMRARADQIAEEVLFPAAMSVDWAERIPAGHLDLLASQLALRAAGALTVHTGSRAVLRDNHAQRLVREAAFLLVFGSRPAIRDALLRTAGVIGPGWSGAGRSGGRG